MSYSGGNPMGFNQGSAYPPYPPAPGGSPYPPAPGGSPYPPAPGASVYPPVPGASPYPPAGGGYPPAPGAAPYPPAPGAAPYPPAPGGSPYPPGAPGGSPYHPAPGAGPYPPAVGGSPYPPAPGAAPYPGAYPPTAGAPSYPPAPGGSPYPPVSGAPVAAGYPPAPGSSPYSQVPGASPYQAAPGGAPYGAPYTQAPATGQPEAVPAYNIPQSNTSDPVGGSLSQYREVPTVAPVSHFDPSSDAAILRKAMKGLGTDEAAIIAVLARRTSTERQQIMLKYQQAYGRDLIRDLKGELSGKFEDGIVALMTPLPLYLAHELQEAMAGFGTNERTLVEILCTRDNASLMVIKQMYQQHYRKRLEDALSGDTSGDFGRLLISMCACSRDERNSDPALANNLAQQLFKAGEGKLGTNEGEFNRIMSSYSYPLLRCVFEEYKKIKGKSFDHAIDSEMSGDLKQGMKAIYHCIENRAAYFAKELHDSMAGMGTKDRALIRLVVSRCEIDMGNIKQEYQRLYNKPLDKAIKNDMSGDVKKLLVAMVEG